MSFKTKFAAVALASTLTAAAFAGGPGDFDSPQTFHPFSVSLNAGANWLGIATSKSANIPSFDAGYSVGGSFDYHFTPNWRAGLSVDYLRNSISKPYTVSGAGDLGQLLILANGYYDFTIGKFVPYIGLGLGMVSATFTSGSSSTDSLFAWAAHLGLNYMLTDQLGLGLGYRFSAWTPNSSSKFRVQAGNTYVSWYNNSVLANVSYHFGG